MTNRSNGAKIPERKRLPGKERSIDMRETLDKDIERRLKELGITPNRDTTTDWTIHQEFLDAGWSTGTKKIRYEASILINEADQTVYMHEKTHESGGGLSIGGEGETYTQRGTTLQRKVRSTHYGPEGKAYEIELNLGAIPEAVREAAKAAGYRFKTVLLKKKAQYPAGTVPTPPAALADFPSVPPTEQGGRTRKGPIAALLLTLGFLAVWNLLAGTSLLGWILSAGILAIGWRLAEQQLKRRTIPRVGTLVLTLLIALIVGAATGTPTDPSLNSGTPQDRAAADAGKVLQGFQLTAGKDWTTVQDSNFSKIYSKAAADIYSKATIRIANDPMDEKLYDDLAKDITLDDLGKYAAYHASPDARITGRSMIRLGEYPALKVAMDTQAVSVTDYLYFINVPGGKDLILHLSSATSAIGQIEAEWTGYLKSLILKYE